MSTGRGAAIVVGVNNYRHGSSLTPLPMARRDARTLARLFVDPAVCAFPREKVSLLVAEKAVRSRIVRRLSDWLPQQARGTELAIIYFAGHGTTDHIGGKQEGYLLPHDADPRHIKDRGIAMGDLVEWIKDIEAESLVVILDCCHAGSLITSCEGISVRSGLRDLVIPPSILHRLTGQGRFLMASCGEGEKSIEVAELGHGLFTHYLIQGIRKEGDANGDGWVGLTELSHYVADNVERHAHSLGHKQRPWTEGKWSKEVVISRTSALATAAAASGCTRIEQLWDSEGPDEAIRVLESEFLDYDEDSLIAVLRLLGEKKAPVCVPIIFRLLADRSETVRKRARKVLLAIGWPRAAAAVRNPDLHTHAERIGFVLEGLAALESDNDVVQLLDQLSRELKGRLQDRASFLHARKRAARDQSQIAALFRDKNIPYDIIKALGEGVYTTAYLGRPRMGHRSVVVRVLRSEFASQKLVRDQFMALAEFWLDYVHHNLVRVRDFNCEESDQPVYYVVRDYLDGPTLREVLQNRVFEPLQIVKIVRQIVEGLSPVHEDGRAHSGVRTSNLFVLSNGRVVLGDLSLPLPLLTTDPRRLAFDYRYMPPETFGEVGPRSDFYSLGCVAYELACGRPPFESDDHHQLIAMHLRDPVPPPRRDGCPLGRAWEEFLGPLLEKAAVHRYRDLDTVLEALDRLTSLLRPRQPDDPGGGPTPEPKSPPPGSPSGDAPAQPAPGQRPLPGPARSSLPSLPPPQGSIGLLGEKSLQECREPESIMHLAGAVSQTNPPQSMDDRTMQDGFPFSEKDEADASLTAGQSISSAKPLTWAGNYELIEEIGRGGMGVVYRARQLSLMREVAIKMIVSARFAHEDVLRRFRHEAVAAANLSHPNIVQVYEMGAAPEQPYIVMEFVRGRSLSQLIGGRPMENRRAAEMAMQVASAIEFAHQHGIVHRDIKPSNILVTVEGIPKVSDFGLALRLQQDDRMTLSGQVLGTPSYMAPEQAQGRGNTGVASDVYSLGAMLYEMLTGQPPFRGNSPAETLELILHSEPTPPSKLNSAVSRDLETICLKCLQKEPTRRYGSADSLKDDLRRSLDAWPILARRTGRIETLRRWVSRNPVVASLAAMVLILLCFLLSVLAFFLSGQRP
jgi:serine/threonine protein kinase